MRSSIGSDESGNRVGNGFSKGNRKRHPVVAGIRPLTRLLVRWRLLWVILVSSLLLSGCVKYDVGIQFSDANHGEIAQYIRFDEQVTGVGDSVLRTWLNTLEYNAKKAGGRIQHPSEQEWLIKIPFYNAKDLESKFNHFFQPPALLRSQTHLADTNLGSHLHLTTGNLVLWQRTRLEYDLDLRGLEFPGLEAERSSDTKLTESPLAIEFRLSTPWGAKVTHKATRSNTGDTTETLSPFVRQQGKQLIWQLHPGMLNHLEVVFWLPSFLGIGLVLIVLAVAVGIYRTSQAEEAIEETL